MHCEYYYYNFVNHNNIMSFSLTSCDSAVMSGCGVSHEDDLGVML